MTLCDNNHSNLLLSSSLSGNSLHINNHLFIDLSKIEQRIPGSKTSRGIGIALLFFIFKYSHQKSLNLIKLVNEFDDMRSKWTHRNEKDKSDDDDNINLLQKIHNRNLNGKCFLWPRQYEIISAANRCRMSTFHKP
jgi:hypothetical protein